jgi:agmatine deiminase
MTQFDASTATMPAEWEPHEAVWLRWPTASTHDAAYAIKLESTWLAMVAAMSGRVLVRMVVEDAAVADHIGHQLRFFGIPESGVELHRIPADDVWMRDSGPIFVKDAAGRMAVNDWNFNGWGGRFSCDRDSSIARAVADILGLPHLQAGITSEGGAIEVNGAGTFLATRSSIINQNRNPNWTSERIEGDLARHLGVSGFIWLDGASPEQCEALGDDTDWHIDIAARFTNETTMLYNWTDDTNDPRYPYLVRHREQLRAARTADGKPLDLVALPAPHVAKISAETFAGGANATRTTDAAYANYLVTNGVVLVPVFGHLFDDRACAIIAEQFPGREIARIPCVTLTEEGGAVHCVSQQQPVAG